MITSSEATIGVFVKLTDGRIPIQTLNFYALTFAAIFLTAGHAPDHQVPACVFRETTLKDTRHHRPADRACRSASSTSP
ncbi:MAG: hypothetical protein U5K76_16110 [Woeseiaceae bacterium]|nr:hypothetical protein [Woeseiaceae bacterium]